MLYAILAVLVLSGTVWALKKIRNACSCGTILRVKVKTRWFPASEHNPERYETTIHCLGCGSIETKTKWVDHRGLVREKEKRLA